MKQFFVAITAFLLLFAVNISAQRTKKQITRKPVIADAAKNESPRPGYNFIVTIGADKSLQLNVVTGYEFRDIDNRLLKKALSEYLMMQEPNPDRKAVGPKVFIHPDSSLDLNTILEVIKTSRVSYSTEVTLDIPDGPSLKIPKTPSTNPNIQIKPNPLTLIVGLNEEKEITLNNERYGSLSDLSPLTNKLRDIFQERGNYEVWREGTNEAEKTVYIKMPLPAQFADLIKIAKALESAGADPIGLQVDDLAAPIVDSRRKLIGQ